MRRAVISGLACGLGLVLAGCAVVPKYTARDSSFEGFPVVTYVPAHPVGIVFLFHGTTGSAGFARRIETTDMLDHLVPRGYGFVSTDSTDRSAKQWDTSSLSLTANADLARLSRLYGSLVASGQISKTTPIYAIGMSRGAAFASVFAQAFLDAGYPVAAIAPSHGPIPASARAAGGLRVPALFALGANDDVVDNSQVERQVADLTRAGVPNALYVEPETRLTAARFLRVPGIDATTANAVFDAIVAARLYDASGRRLVSTGAVDASLPSLRLPPSVSAAQKRMLQDEVDVVMAVHTYSATYAPQTLAFFDAHR